MPRARAAAWWLLLCAACTQGPSPARAQSVVRPRVIAVHPHDPHAFTEGLVWHAGKLYESTGIYGQSSLRRVDPASGEVEQHVELPESLFGEGLALVDGRLLQLTWQSGHALVYAVADFTPGAMLPYEGEGWGLCFDGQQLVMSDGSSRLVFRDPNSFALRSELDVERDGLPLSGLNELECVGRFVYANVWPTDEIVQIDAQTGAVSASIDASGLLTPEQERDADVLNGIAFDPERGHFYLTGKLWPLLFEVSFELDADRADADAGAAPADAPTQPRVDPNPDLDPGPDPSSDPSPDPELDPDPNGAPSSSIEPLAPRPVHASEPAESSHGGFGCAVSPGPDPSALGCWLVLAWLARRSRRA